MKNTVLIDANIVIRFLLKDHSKLFQKANSLFQKAERGEINLYLDELAVAEIVWTLSSFYKIKRAVISARLDELISQNSIVNPKKKLLLMTLDLYKSTNLDYIDCWLYVISKSLKVKLETFDEDLNKLLRRV